jgi:hypothetical protein
MEIFQEYSLLNCRIGQFELLKREFLFLQSLFFRLHGVQNMKHVQKKLSHVEFFSLQTVFLLLNWKFIFETVVLLLPVRELNFRIVTFF